MVAHVVVPGGAERLEGSSVPAPAAMSGRNNNKLPSNLPQLQNLIKRDPPAYTEEVRERAPPPRRGGGSDPRTAPRMPLGPSPPILGAQSRGLCAFLIKTPFLLGGPEGSDAAWCGLWGPDRDKAREVISLNGPASAGGRCRLASFTGRPLGSGESNQSDPPHQSVSRPQRDPPLPPKGGMFLLAQGVCTWR